MGSRVTWTGMVSVTGSRRAALGFNGRHLDADGVRKQPLLGPDAAPTGPIRAAAAVRES